MNEAELRREAVRRRQAGETTEAIAASLGRTGRWVRKWVARHDAAEAGADWAQSHSRAPKRSPRRTPERLRRQVLDARTKLEANPMSQYGALAIAWVLQLLGVEQVPEVWTINRILADAGLTRCRGRTPGYQSKGAPYPHPITRGPGEYHQADLIGPRNLDGGIGFHAFNLIDIGTHTAGSEIIDILRPTTIAASLATIWGRVGIPKVVQFDNHSNLRGGIPPRASTFGPVVATCLDLGVIARFAPLREPWRNGVVEHFNDVWDKSFFRTARYPDLDILREATATFEAFHNARHRYSAHRGASPDEMRTGLALRLPPEGYQPPGRLPAKGRIEAVRYVRSDGLVNLWGHKIHLPTEQTYQYVTAVISVRAKQLRVVTRHGEIIHAAGFDIDRHLR
jgi:putative transposase